MQPCSSSPTYAVDAFDDQVTDKHLTNQTIEANGFKMLADLEYTNIYFNDTSPISQKQYMYSVDTILQDNWLKGENARYGSIGVGPWSPIWSGTLYKDSSTSSSIFSISVARIDSDDTTEIAFGYAASGGIG